MYFIHFLLMCLSIVIVVSTDLRAILTALFSRRFLAFPASVKTACASLNLRPHLLLLSIKSACGGGRYAIVYLSALLLTVSCGSQRLTSTEPQPNRNRTATEPQPNLNPTATEPQPNRDRTATEPRPNRNRTATEPQPQC